MDKIVLYIAKIAVLRYYVGKGYVNQIKNIQIKRKIGRVSEKPQKFRKKNGKAGNVRCMQSKREEVYGDS